MAGRLRRRVRRALGRSTTAFPAGQRLETRKDLAEYEIGRFSWGHLSVSSRTPGAHLRVGQFCSFAYGCHVILGGEHRADFVSTYRFPAYPPFKAEFSHLAGDTATTKGDVTIGNDVWMGHQVLVLSGVELGDGVIVGAGSVVRSSAPPYAIVAGNPARVAGFRFPKDQIEALLRIRWWDWPVDRITEAMDLLMSEEIDAFLERYDRPSTA